MTRGPEGGGDSGSGSRDSGSSGGNDSSESGRRSGSFGGSSGERGGSFGSRGGTNSENGNSNGESGNSNGENGGSNGEGGGENGEGGGENPKPRDCDPVRDEAIPRPRKRDNDYYWPIPEINTPTVRISASGGYGTEVRPSGPSRVAESTVGGGTLVPTLEIGNFS